MVSRQNAMKVIGFEPQSIQALYRVVGGILHLGNVNFDGAETARVENPEGKLFISM